ncbi:MAG: M20/M25/M40 family metallo-hydrolase [Candidatus Vecturithrix sp.]|jgi:acetylornithine deacetylase/succinyl-diaminopimelate desuccinylase-like protein|nr:M20/M25/M40 family metallo-hydrolase [Candidatus Vecturithrix sp.]
MDFSLLEQMVSIPSTFPQEAQLAEFLYNELQRAGFSVVKQYAAENRFNVLAEKGAGEKALMFYGHLDTVPLYGEWDSDPYRLTARDDRLFGLGAADMKGGMFAILEAAKRLELPKGRKIKIALCVDEENESIGAYALSADPFLQDVQLIIAAEIGDARPEKEGAKTISLGRRGRVGITISVPGISAHGAMPEQGINAIEEAVTCMQALEKMSLPFHEKLGQSHQFVQEIFAQSGSLSLPDRCDIMISRLLVPPETPESVLKEMQQYLDSLYTAGVMTPRQGRKAEAAFATRDTPYYSPYLSDETLPQIQRLMQRLRIHFGDVNIGYGLSVADENIFGGINKIPTVTVGPQGGNEHSANEWVSRSSLEQLVEVYCDLMHHLE